VPCRNASGRQKSTTGRIR
jgi:hypothetical protein